MTDIDRLIAEVQRLDREAPGGAWTTELHGHVRALYAGRDRQHHGLRLMNLSDGDNRAQATEETICYYRTAAPLLAAEVQRLRAGGCARDQRMTQFCAEAVAKDAEIDRLRAEVERLQVLGPDTEARVVVEARTIASDMLQPAIASWKAYAATVEKERDDLRALWHAEQQQEHRQTARECGDARHEAQQLRAEVATLRQGFEAERAAALRAHDLLIAEREAARLTIAAEQGRQEGATVEPNDTTDEYDYTRCICLDGVSRWCPTCGEEHAERRAAMQAADVAQEPR